MWKTNRTYLDVLAKIDTAGRLTPLRVIWIDGRRFDVDKVIDVKSAAARKAGGMGDRYLVEIGGKRTCLFFERGLITQVGCVGRWFVEGKE